MKCIYCNRKTSVKNSRPSSQKSYVWRRRFCDKCQKTFSTRETPNHEIVSVVLKGKKHSFNIGKLTVSIFISMSHNKKEAENSCYHLAETIFYKIINSAAKNKKSLEISSDKLKIITYKTLNNFDPLAALQYGARKNILSSIRKPKRGRPSVESIFFD